MVQTLPITLSRRRHLILELDPPYGIVARVALRGPRPDAALVVALLAQLDQPVAPGGAAGLAMALGSTPLLLFCEIGVPLYEMVCQDLGAKLGGLRLPLRLGLLLGLLRSV